MVVEFKDRLARFGFTFIEQYLNSFGAKVEIVNGEEPKSLQEELVQDMLSILTVFSAKLYGAKSKGFRQKVKEAMAGAAEVALSPTPAGASGRWRMPGLSWRARENR